MSFEFDFRRKVDGERHSGLLRKIHMYRRISRVDPMYYDDVLFRCEDFSTYFLNANLSRIPNAQLYISIPLQAPSPSKTSNPRGTSLWDASNDVLFDMVLSIASDM